MKRIPLFLAMLLWAAGAAAQNPTAYFMEGSTFRTQFNPAFAPLRGYVNIPFVGSIQAGITNNLPLSKLLYPRDGRLVTLLDPSVSADEALAGLKTDNLLGTEVRMSLIGFGKFTKNHKNFWSFDLNLRTNAEFNVPGALFEFIKRGDEGSIRNLGLEAEMYADAGVSYSLPLLGDKLYVGAKAKFIVGLARAKVNFDRMDITLHDNRWAVEAQGSIEANIPGAEVNYRYDDYGQPYFESDDIEINKIKPAGYGFAVDLGATYEILPGLQASLAVTDLGFINWSKTSTVAGRAETSIEYTGIMIENGETSSTPDFSLDDLKQFRPIEAKGSVRALQASVNAGLGYFMWDHRVGFGLLYQARFREFKTLHSVTGSINFSPIRWFTLSGSYTAGSGMGAFGLALNLCPGWINFFVGTDLVATRFTPQFIPVKQKSMNVTFGLGIPLGRRSHRVAEYVRASDRK
ncbi:DUF5723 family protein [uncultured Alistipes sp.]|jgi:hypothetical protein|uniref:DUF5723 family protein n=3 Tax=uncultured Alistipes sp. TaxID=538949 RepID=UPI002638A4C1|nr:DUF5723 family protein [uncultured Alistipes sp.]